MLGNNISSVGWPECGEIDIMELVGGTNGDNKTHGTIHWDNAGEHAQAGAGYSLPTGKFADEYHVFSIIWDDSQIKWMMNDIEFYSVSIASDGMDEFHQNFFFIINVAVGGNWPGNPDSTTIFPQQMKVDYIRVFQSN
jgi:beta-glucanase (GH16 family)